MLGKDYQTVFEISAATKASTFDASSSPNQMLPSISSSLAAIHLQQQAFFHPHKQVQPS
jgi:hypothetical protein